MENEVTSDGFLRIPRTADLSSTNMRVYEDLTGHIDIDAICTTLADVCLNEGGD
jgi:hypothetical protein